jgi:hypothetical protein
MKKLCAFVISTHDVMVPLDNSRSRTLLLRGCRPGNDFTRRFPLIVEALERLRSRSCIIDGEAVACDDNGVASFDLIRNHRANDSVFSSPRPPL